jgi:serine/threonine protein phosphatase PrpC
MASQQAVNFIRQRLANHNDLDKATKELTKEAVTKQRSVDNVSIVVVAFNQHNPQQPPSAAKKPPPGHIPSSF